MQTITSRALELTKQLYTSTAIRKYDPKLSEQIAGYNRLMQADLDGGRVRWLASSQSQLGDWSINRGGIEHLLNSLQEQKIVAGIVVLTKSGAVVNSMPVAEVAEKLKDVRWLDGKGEFCWVDENFNPIDRNRDRYITDPDEPM